MIYSTVPPTGRAGAHRAPSKYIGPDFIYTFILINLYIHLIVYLYIHEFALTFRDVVRSHLI